MVPPLWSVDQLLGQVKQSGNISLKKRLKSSLLHCNTLFNQLKENVCLGKARLPPSDFVDPCDWLRNKTGGIFIGKGHKKSKCPFGPSKARL